MKLHRKDFRIFKDLIYVLPAIVLVLNDPIYEYENFALEFRWLVFHMRILWFKEADYES